MASQWQNDEEMMANYSPPSSPRFEEEDVDAPGQDILTLMTQQQEDKRKAIVSRVPTEYRSKAEKILVQIWPFIRLTEDNDLLYWGPAGETEKGTSVLILLLYCLLPEAERKKNFPSVDKPIDFHQFRKVLRFARVGGSDLRSDIDSDTDDDDDKTISVENSTDSDRDDDDDGRSLVKRPRKKIVEKIEGWQQLYQ